MLTHRGSHLGKKLNLPLKILDDFLLKPNTKNFLSSKGGEHRSERNEITSSQLTDTGEFNKD